MPAIHRCSGGMSRARADKSRMSVGSNLRCRWCVDGGLFATDSPGRHSVAGRIGRGVNPPPQFGQTLSNSVSTHVVQNVHPQVQMRAFVASGGRSRSQNSQFGRSSSAMTSSGILRRGARRFGGLGKVNGVTAVADPLRHFVWCTPPLPASVRQWVSVLSPIGPLRRPVRSARTCWSSTPRRPAMPNALPG